MPPFRTNPAAIQSGLLGPGVENDQAQSELGAIGMLKGIPSGLLQGAMIPGEVAQGRAEANVPNAVALSGLMGGGSLLTANPANALGIFGGKLRSAVGKPQVSAGAGGGMGMINQRIRIPSGAEGEVVSLISRNLKDRSTVDLNLNFSVRNPKTGVLSTDLAGLGAKEGRELFTAAMNEARHHVEQVRPGRVNFKAAHPSLVPIYRRVAKQLAKETGGKAKLSTNKSNPVFNVELPNPRRFEATGEGLLGKSAAARQADVDKAKIRLNQLQYDRRLSKRAGVDVDGAGYARINTQIRMLRDQIKAAGEELLA